jgi:hypothetical protein
MSWLDEDGIEHESDDTDESPGEDLTIGFEPDFDLSENGIHDNDTINPSYYRQGKMECIDAIEGLELPFHEAQILKYIVRWRSKNGTEDLKKAKWYLDRLINISIDDIKDD